MVVRPSCVISASSRTASPFGCRPRFSSVCRVACLLPTCIVSCSLTASNVCLGLTWILKRIRARPSDLPLTSDLSSMSSRSVLFGFGSCFLPATGCPFVSGPGGRLPSWHMTARGPPGDASKRSLRLAGLLEHAEGVGCADLEASPHRGLHESLISQEADTRGRSLDREARVGGGDLR